MKVCVTSVKNITSPVTVCFEGKTLEFANGKELAEYEFEKNYLIVRIYSDNGKITIELKENDRMNNTNWIGEEQVGFF